MNLTIQGNTSVNCSGTAGTAGYICSASDATIIQDAYTTNSPLMTFTVGSSSSQFRITGLTLRGGNIGGSYSKYDGYIKLYSGNSQNVRIDHNHFNNNTYSPANEAVALRNYAPTAGVMDHNLMEMGSDTSYSFGLSDFGAYNDSVGNGDGTFNQATPWGQLNGVWFLESNYITGGVSNDCGNAGFMVIRNNTMSDNATGIITHGTKSPAGPERGCRGYEAYHNYFTHPGGGSTGDAATGSKAGTAMIWGNTMTNGYYRFYAPSTDRSGGDSAAETNTPNGWGYCGTAVNGNGSGSAWDGNSNSSSGYPCLDNIGRGKITQSLNGADFPNRINSAAGRIAWPHQMLEPVYLFANSISPASGVSVDIRDLSTQPNRDIYADCNGQTQKYSGGSTSCSSFNGTAGTGSGPLSSRPSTCTAGQGGTYFSSPTGSYGVAYWATDANSGNGELYVCTSANTWTGIYQPATYPHPLVSGSSTKTSSTPPAPTGLVGTVY